jgi:hypothetical protein
MAVDGYFGQFRVSSCGNDPEVPKMVCDDPEWQLMDILGSFKYSHVEMIQNSQKWSDTTLNSI